MTTFRARGPGPILGLTITLAAQGSIVISSSTVFGTSARTLAGAAGSANGTVGTGSSTWTVSPPTFVQGSGQTFDVAATGPSGKVAGGAYDVDLTGTPLPAGMTLSAAGSLNVGTAIPGSANGVVFEYAEPGAMATLTLHPTATGTLPYLATWYPPEGVVPSGSAVVSPDDANLRSSVLSAWPDNSAQVVVLAGETPVTNGVTKAIRLRVGAQQGVPLTVTRVGQLVSSIAVNFGGGVQTLSSFGSPDRTWWANERVICARYRLSCGLGVMEAVIDIHAFSSSHAFVEVAIENGKFNANGTSQPVPASQSYTNATVAVNGTTIATVSSSGSPSGSHRGGMAWHASAKVVGGVVTALTTAQQQGETFGIEVTHDTASMQAHPLLFRMDQASTVNMQTTYQSDAYTPWAIGRQGYNGMSVAGDHDWIGYLPKWDAHYLQTGSKFARRGVLAAALATLVLDIHYRHNGTGASNNHVPDFDQQNGKKWDIGTWPTATAYNDDGGWAGSHHPAVGLMAFLCRPSPYFIEIAQRAVLKTYSWSDGFNSGPPDGTMGPWYAVRARAWGFRSFAHVLFLTPTSHPWRTPAVNCLIRNVTGSLFFRDNPKSKLNTPWGGDPYICWDDSAGGTFQHGIFQSFYFIQGTHALANAKVLTGTDQANAVALADWAATFPVRYCNESPGGAFRTMAQRFTIGATGAANFVNAAMDQYADWGAWASATMGGTVPAVSGPWLSEADTASNWGTYGTDTSAGAYYPSYYWAALCVAVERGISGADAAWTKVTGGNITNLGTWRNGFQTEPRWGYYPRNK